MKKLFFIFCISQLLLGCKKKYVQIVPTISLQHIVSPLSENLNSICFISSSEGFIGGAKGSIYKTSNGGNTWTNISLLDKTNDVKKVVFITQLKGFCLTQEDIFRTLDGGITWTSVLNTNDKINDIQFITPNIGYAVGGEYTQAVYKTTNGGSTWNKKYSPPGIDNPFYAVSFINKDTGYASVSEHRIFETINGGTSWNTCKTGDYRVFSDLAFTAYRTGYVTGQFGYIEYQDNSSSFGEQLISDSYYAYNINSITHRNGRSVAVGEYSILMPYKNTESKFKWTYFLSPEGTTIPYTYNDVVFADDFTFYAVGNSGVITKFKYPN
ncbi:MAG: YCF48-related protein [Bacteroidota bacterium]